MQQDATAMTDVCFPWPPAGTSTLSSVSSKRDPSKAAAVMNHAESCGIRKLWRTCSRLFTKNLSFWRCCVLNSVDFDITSSFRSLQIPMIFVHLLTRRPQSHSSVSGFQVSAPEIWSSCTKASVSECFRCLRNLGAKYFWRRISGDHSTPKIVQGADNGTLAGALGYAAWQLHDGVWWLFLMVINGNPEMCSSWGSWGSWGLISRGSKQRQSRSHSNELPRRDLQGCWDQLGMGHFTLSCNIL